MSKDNRMQQRDSIAGVFRHKDYDENRVSPPLGGVPEQRGVRASFLSRFSEIT